MNEVPSFVAHYRSSDGAWQSLESHLLGVGDLAGRAADKLKLKEWGLLLGLLHDLGKYSQDFQRYLKSATGELNQDEDEDWVDAQSLKGKVDHSSAGAQLAWQRLGSKVGETERIAAQVLALCVASHHSGLIDCIGASTSNFGEDNFTKRMNKAQQKTHLEEVLAVGERQVLDRCEQLLASPSLLSRLDEVINDITRHNTGDQASSVQVVVQQLGLLVRFLFSCLIDADRVDSADFEHHGRKQFRPSGKYADWPVLKDRLERHLATLAPRRPIDRLRQEISNHCQQAAGRPVGIYTLTVPTGGGKTLASLRFALHHAEQRGSDRIVYVIPFTSIIDQNAQVVRSILEPDDVPMDRDHVVLEHHGSVTPEQQTWREKMLCENWDAPVIYTTMVQFLEALFGAGTRGARRMHQLANAVLIFDEVQTLPIKCVHLFNNAINFLAAHCGSTVVLCTATQPLLDHVAKDKGAVRLAVEHELMPNKQELFDKLKRVTVCDARKPGGWTYQEVATLALAEAQRSGSCLVIVNTKAAARRIFEMCASRLALETVCHLSTDMCPAHRKLELAKLRARLDAGQPMLCVSTQLIEAGVDVDFGAVIRFMAGLDSIAQAAGRCNRHGRPEPGLVHIVNPQDENLDKLPDILLGRDAANRVLDEYAREPVKYRENLVGPEALSDYYRYYFFARKGDMSYAVSASETGQADTLLNLLSLNQYAVNDFGSHNKSAPNIFFRQAFMTAAKAFKTIDAPTQGVVVPYGKLGRQLIADLHAAYDVEKEIDLLRTAQQFTVNVFPHALRKLQQAQAVHEVKPDTRILCLDERYYSALFGLATEPVSMMEPLHD